MKLTITILCTIILILQAYELYLKVDMSTNNTMFAGIQAELKAERKETILLKAQKLELTSYTTLSRKAEEQGFIYSQPLLSL